MEKAKPTYQKPSSANKAKVRVPLTPPPMPWLPKNQKKEAERKAEQEKKKQLRLSNLGFVLPNLNDF